MKRRRRWSFATIVVLLLLISGASDGGGSRWVTGQEGGWAPPWSVYVSETGHTVSGAFLDSWRAWGGPYAWGNPISEEVEENGRIVQYYEFARLEHWPEDPNGNVVHLGRIGVELCPIAIPRRPAPSADGRVTSAGRDAAGMALAWVPLDFEVASSPNTESWRYVPETGHSVQLGFKGFWEQSGEVWYLGNPMSEEYVLGDTTYQVFERGQLAWRLDRDPYMVPVGLVLAQRHGLDTSPVDQGYLPVYSEDLFVPPPTPTPIPVPIVPIATEPAQGGPDPYAERWIAVSLRAQYLVARQGDVVVLETYVSTGRAGFETPTGTFWIVSKYDSQDMEGVIGGENYNVPGVPWVMYFTNDGHAIHGTYWHSNFGVPMSHGCVNLPMWAAEFLYGWAPIGTRVEVYW